MAKSRTAPTPQFIAAIYAPAIVLSCPCLWSVFAVDGPTTGLAFFLMSLAIALNLIVSGVLLLRSSPATTGTHCCRCGYDLRATAGPRCPECGAPADESPARVDWTTVLAATSLLIGLFLLGIALLLGPILASSGVWQV